MTDQQYTNLAIWSQILGAFAFLAVVVWLWVRFLTPAIVASRDRKNAELAQAERARDAAKEEIDVARHELAVASSDAQAIRSRGHGDAKTLQERILAEAIRDGERQVHNAEGQLQFGRAAARETLRLELIAKALDIARESASRLGDDVDRRLTGDVVESLERGGGN